VDSLERAYDALALEIIGEQAASLGRAAKRLEDALAALARESPSSARAAVRSALVDAAGEALWAYVVQREAVGFVTDEDAIAAAYGVSAEVRRRVGFFRRA
jgi:L-alanine-DL-glutamate epimerase-like enolase superfamily enzyme